ncbi:MAG: MBOAT family O-acyltransferase [Pyrinomonadaceae bacterium]
MANVPLFLVSILAYVLCARLVLSLSNSRQISIHFAVVNVVAFAWLSLLSNFSEWQDATILSLGNEAIVRHLILIGLYVAAISIGFFLTRWFAKAEGWIPWIAFFYPVGLLVVFKYLHSAWEPLLAPFDWDEWVLAATIIGLSYMAFRLSYLVLEVRNSTVSMPTLSQYLGFAFFLPTMIVGPINPYSVHQASIGAIRETTIPIGRCLLRILVGATKYLFLANLANQLSYSGIFSDGKPHSFFDLGIAVVFYYLFLFLNFSGFCDMAIGLAGLLGIRVLENFDNPFAARNVKEFWNRWHKSLSEYTRNVIFAPLSKGLIKAFGTKYTNFCIALTVLAVFLVIGIWHGVGWRFAIFGLIHAVGVIANHFYTLWLKGRLGKERYNAYNENRLVNLAARVVTFGYVAVSFAVFANDYEMMGTIRNALR